MHHASKMLLKLFTLFHPRQLSSEHTYARSHPAEGAGAWRSAGCPGSRAAWPLAIAWAGSPRQADDGEVFPPLRLCCWESGAHLRRGDALRRRQAGVVPVPPPRHPWLRSPAATEQHISLCRDLLQIFLLPQVRQRGGGDGDSPSSGEGQLGWLAGWMHGEEHIGTDSLAPAGAGQAELWMKGTAGRLSHVKSTRAWGKPAWRAISPLSASNHVSMGHSSSPGLHPAPQTAVPRGVPVAARLSPALAVSGLTSMVRNPSFHKEVK